MKMNKQKLPEGWKEVELGNGLKPEKVQLIQNQKMIASCNGKYIFVNKNFLKLSIDKQKLVIYHERGHSKRLSKILMNISNIFYILLGFSLAIGFIKISITQLDYSFINSFKESFPISWKDLLYLFIIGFVGASSLKWFVELYCDFNAIKNTNKELYLSALKNAGEVNKIKRNKVARIIYWIPNKIYEFVLHPPMFIRSKLIEELD